MPPPGAATPVVGRGGAVSSPPTPPPPTPPPVPPPAASPPVSERAMAAKPPFLEKSTRLTLASADRRGRPAARASISARRACRMREAAIRMSGLPASARATRLSSSASPNTRHQCAGSTAAPGGCGPTKAAGTCVAGGA